MESQTPDALGPAQAPSESLDRLRIGLIVTTDGGRVSDANLTARRLVASALGRWPDDATCCAIFGCREREPLARFCISELAAQSADPLPELRVDLPHKSPTNAVWVTAARGGEGPSPILIHLRPAIVGDRRQRTQPHWMEGSQLRIDALGRTRIATQETAIEGRWLLQRPGQLLKYLVSQRGRPAHVDEIAEALWPKAGISGRSTARYYVHALRELLEPLREPHSTSPFIVSVQGSYSIDPRVEVDVDEFEALAQGGLRQADDGKELGVETVALLREAAELYRGDLFQEEPFATWAFAERDRLRSLALGVLRALVDHYRAAGDADRAIHYLERSAALWPLDSEVQRALISLYLRQGRRSDCQRRYAAYRQRLQDEFGQEPDFELADLMRNDG